MTGHGGAEWLLRSYMSALSRSYQGDDWVRYRARWEALLLPQGVYGLPERKPSGPRGLQLSGTQILLLAASEAGLGWMGVGVEQCQGKGWKGFLHLPKHRARLPPDLLKENHVSVGIYLRA